MYLIHGICAHQLASSTRTEWKFLVLLGTRIGDTVLVISLLILKPRITGIPSGTRVATLIPCSELYARHALMRQHATAADNVDTAIVVSSSCFIEPRSTSSLRKASPSGGLQHQKA